MTQKHLNQIKQFSKPYYKKTGKYHDWIHVQTVRKHCLMLAKDYKEVDINMIQAICYLHDIGRSVKDVGHGEESVILATPLLKKIGLPKQEMKVICNGIACHEAEKATMAKSIEAKVFFDADKLEILSVYGFIRVVYFLVDEREMELVKAINFLWKYVKLVRRKHLFTNKAKMVVDEQLPVIKQMVEKCNQWVV